MAAPLRVALQFDLFRDRQGVIDFYAEVAHGALQLCMTAFASKSDMVERPAMY